MLQSDEDPLAEFGLEAIDLRWTLKDIAGKRWSILNQAHVPKLIELGLVEMREDRPFLTVAGQDTAWESWIAMLALPSHIPHATERTVLQRSLPKTVDTENDGGSLPPLCRERFILGRARLSRAR
jgi:hypothetical protein